MKEIQLKDAKARFSHVVDEAVRGAPSVVTRHGKPKVVVVSYDEFQRLSKVPSFGWLLANAPIKAGDLEKDRRRPARALKDSTV